MTRRGKKKSQNAPTVPSGPLVVPARVEGTTLILKLLSGKEETHKWTGPSTAHHAQIDLSDQTLVYTVRLERKISVFDEANTLLGEIVEETWM